MKQKIATSSVKQLIATGMLIVSAVVVVISAALNTSAVDYSAQIQDLQQKIDQYEHAAGELSHQAQTLENAIAALEAEQASLQAKINLSQAKHDKLVHEIADNERRLELQKSSLKNTIGDLYVDGRVTPIEMLASSKNIGDFIDKQEYRSVMKDQIQETMAGIEETKQKLAKQKVAVEEVLNEQKAQRAQLAAKEAERSRLLAVTRGQEAQYRNLVSELKDKKAEAEAALAASLSSGSYKVAAVGPVSAGEIIGAVGNTGLSSGPHLHLEVRRGGSVTNPSPYIRNDPIAMPPGFVSQSYGNPDPIYYGGYHPGTDYATGSGAPIYAIDSGYMYRGCSDQMLGTSNNAYGYVAIVEHASGVISVYAHMSGGPAGCNYNTYY